MPDRGSGHGRQFREYSQRKGILGFYGPGLPRAGVPVDDVAAVAVAVGHVTQRERWVGDPGLGQGQSAGFQ